MIRSAAQTVVYYCQQTSRQFVQRTIIQKSSLNGQYIQRCGFSTRALRLDSGYSLIPHPEKVARGGEDAFFIAENGYAIGVADGVGGWAYQGVDPGIYARSLMSNAKSLAEKAKLSEEAPMTLMSHAYKESTMKGSATACILVLLGQTLYAANVGDSGFMHCRGKQIVYQSPAQTVEFNFPYQLGYDAESNNPEDAQRFKLTMQAGDFLVTATDGVLDNVYPQDVALFVGQLLNEGCSVTECATKLALVTQKLAQEPKYMSPFAKGAQERQLNYMGGKLDDITVIVSRVIEDVPAAEGDGGGEAEESSKSSGSWFSNLTRGEKEAEDSADSKDSSKVKK